MAYCRSGGTEGVTVTRVTTRRVSVGQTVMTRFATVTVFLAHVRFTVALARCNVARNVTIPGSRGLTLTRDTTVWIFGGEQIETRFAIVALAPGGEPLAFTLSCHHCWVRIVLENDNNKNLVES